MDLPGTMPTLTTSWPAVEEKMSNEFAIWKSKICKCTRPQSQPEESVDLVEGASMNLTGNRFVTIHIGKLEWMVAPPSGYTGYCEIQDDWLVVSRSGYRVALRSPHGSAILPVCPCSGQIGVLESQALSSLPHVHEDMPGLMSRFFTSGETGPTARSTLRRTMSQKKLAEIIETKFGAPFLECVNGLQNATDISDVLDTILGFSAVYMSNQQVLQQTPEDPYLEDSYFYDIEVMMEFRSFGAKRGNATTWVRQQVREAAMKCQVAAEAVSEVAKLGAGMLLKVLEPTTPSFDSDDSETDEPFKLNNTSSSSALQEGFISGSSPMLEDQLILQLSASRQNLNSEKHESCPSDPNGFSLDYDLIGFENWEDRVDGPAGAILLQTPSSDSAVLIDVEMDTSSSSSWDFVRDAKANDVEEDGDILGAGISDAESLDLMLRDPDSLGCNGSRDLVNEFVSLHISSSAASSSSTDQEQDLDGNKLRKCRVLKRLASWSSLSSVSKKIRTLQLETLAEEPLCDPKTARACRSFIMRAAVAGDVLQWCSCKYNNSRSSIELTFQVGSFMDDDIATLSTGISRALPLRIEIFLDPTDVRQSLLAGKVRISTDQGAPKENTPRPVRPVIGLACYIPHVVRQYLQQWTHKQANKQYDVADGELFTGLMKHVVSKLVFLKDCCCVCDHQKMPDMITSMVPKPCDQNLCQALHDLWLELAPLMVLERSTVERWLKTSCFEKNDTADEYLMHQYSERSDVRSKFNMSYDEKLEMVMKWIKKYVVAGSWLRLVDGDITMTDQELQYRADLETFPRRHDRRDSFETILKAWDDRYREAQRTRR